MRQQTRWLKSLNLHGECYMRRVRCGFVLPRAFTKSARLVSLALNSASDSRPRKSSWRSHTRY